MTEREWQDRVVRAARERGWRCSHDPDSRRQEEGEPDVEFTWAGGGPCPCPAAALRIEFKIENRRRTAAQRRTANRMILAGQVVLECQVPDDLDIVAEALAIQLTGAPDATAAQQVGPPQGIECSQWAELVRMCGSPARAIETLRRNGYPTEEP